MVDACGRRVGPDLPLIRAAVCALTGMVGAAPCAPVDGGHPLACRLAPDRRSARCGQPRAAACGGARPARCDRVADRRGARCRCSRTLRTTSPARRQARPVRAGCALRSVRLPVWCAPSVHGFGRFEDLDGCGQPVDRRLVDVLGDFLVGDRRQCLQVLSEAHEQRQADGSALRRPDPCHGAGSRTRSCSFPSWWRGRSARRASRRPGG